MRPFSTSLACIPLIALLACSDDPPPPTEVRAAIANDLGRVLREAKAASDGSLAELPTSLLDRVRGKPAADSSGGGSGDSGSAEVALDFDPDAVVDALENELFTDANHLGGGIYRVPASLVCERSTFDSMGNETTHVDPECASRLDQAQVRVRVAAEGAGMRFFLQVDADHDEPLSVLVTPDELALTIDLAQAGAAIASLSALFGEPAPNARLAGQLTGSVKILGTARARVALTFDRPLAIAFADDGISLDGPGAFRFSSAAAPVIALELDGSSRAAKLAVALGETRVHEPADEWSPERDIEIAGATVDATYDGATLALANISLGGRPATETIAGQLARSIDLNPDHGGALDATIAIDASTGIETLSVAPRFDLRQFHDHALLGTEPPVYDMTRILLEGTVRGAPGAAAIEVVSGSFAIATSPAQYGFSATAGQCVTATEIYDDATFMSYTQFSVGACP